MLLAQQGVCVTVVLCQGLTGALLQHRVMRLRLRQLVRRPRFDQPAVPSLLPFLAPHVPAAFAALQPSRLVAAELAAFANAEPIDLIEADLPVLPSGTPLSAVPGRAQ